MLEERQAGHLIAVRLGRLRGDFDPNGVVAFKVERGSLLEQLETVLSPGLAVEVRPALVCISVHNYIRGI